MKIGRDTRKRVEAIKQEMDDPIRKLETHIARLNEHAGTKRMVVPLKNAVEKIARWKNTEHF